MAADPLLDALDTLLAARRSRLGGWTREALAHLAADLSVLLNTHDPGPEDEAVLHAAMTFHSELDARLRPRLPGTPPSVPRTRPTPEPGERPDPTPDTRPKAASNARPTPKPPTRPTPEPDARPTYQPGARPTPNPDARRTPDSDAGDTSVRAKPPKWTVELTGRLLADAATAQWLAPAPPDHGDPAWAAAALLRLPVGEAERRREEMKRTAPESADVLRPPEGVRADVTRALGPAGLERYRDVAAVISDVLNAVQFDPGLWTAFGPATNGMPLADERTRARYHAGVLESLERLASAGTNTADSIDWLVRVDEAVRSVYPLPLPAPDSWWRRLGERSFTALRRHVEPAAPGAKVGLIQDGPYGEGEAGIRAPKEERNIGIDAGPARRGQILWCLRAWYELTDANPPRIRGGRILYGR